MLRDGGEGARVFREARAAEARARMQEILSDAPVHADGACDIVNVAADAVAEVGDFVDERNFGREKCVGRVLR